jgi:hypothetical protein
MMTQEMTGMILTIREALGNSGMKRKLGKRLGKLGKRLRKAMDGNPWEIQ